MAQTSLNERIAQYLFAPNTWVNPERLQELVSAPVPYTPNLICRVVRAYRPKVVPSDFDDFAMRLALLTKEEWQLLGLGVCLLPYRGKIANAIDGHLRRAVKAQLSAEQIAQLDAWSGETVVFQLEHWRDIAMVVEGGIGAIVQACGWNETVLQYTQLRFDKTLGASAVEGLTLGEVNTLCKHLLPNHSWLS